MRTAPNPPGQWNRVRRTDATTSMPSPWPRGAAVPICSRCSSTPVRRYRPHGVPGLLVACALGDEAAARALLDANPDVSDACHASGGEWLALAAGNGNVAALRCLMAVGVPVGAVWAEGDGYFGIAPASTALHVAAWRAQHDAVRYLLDQAAPVDGIDGAGRTALQLAVRACTMSFWRDRRQPTSIAALLAAGAVASRVVVPTGYDEADRLLIDERPDGTKADGR